MTGKFQFHEENAMYAQAAIKTNVLFRNDVYGTFAGVCKNAFVRVNR